MADRQHTAKGLQFLLGRPVARRGQVAVDDFDGDKPAVRRLGRPDFAEPAAAEPNVGQAVLKLLGIDAFVADPELTTLLESIPRAEPGKSFGLSPAAAQVLESARAQSSKLGYRYVGTEHLLLGILAAGDSG